MFKKYNGYLKRDRLADERLHEDLHASTETENQVKSRLLLDVVIRKGVAVLELLSSENETLLVGRNTKYTVSESEIKCDK